MRELPKRDDDIYKEIESFADYELTQCVAYEMAIRNDEVINSLNRITDYYDDDIFDKFQKDKTNQSYKDSHEQYKKDNDILEAHGLYYSTIHDYGYFSKYHFLKKPKEIKKQAKMIDESKIGSHNFLNKDTKIAMNFKNKVEFSQRLVKGKYSDIENVIDYVEYESEAIIKYSRQKLSINNIKKTVIEFNMSLPRAELEAQFKHILDTYKKEDTIKSPLELMGEEQQEADKKHIQKKPKSHVYSDWFYIYDYWKYKKKLNISDETIFIDIELINDDFNKKDNIRKIRDKMKYFIEDLGYQELITGAKIL